jgi:hypothetical protein
MCRHVVSEKPVDFTMNIDQPGTGVFHYVTLLMPGDMETVRSRLVSALKQMGYTVVSEQPLQARHGGRRRWKQAHTVLDYPRTLAITLNSSGERTTSVTFDYIMTMMDTRGNKQSLTREVEAMVALTRQAAGSTSCAACGTEAITDSRFCRRCGAPLTMEKPGEIEVMRLTAGGSAAREKILVGAVFLFSACLGFLFTHFLTTDDKWVMFSLSALAGGAGWLSILLGLRLLHRTLNLQRPTEALPRGSSHALSSWETTALPEPSVPVSVTEGTTDLLDAEHSPPLPHHQHGRDTA